MTNNQLEQIKNVIDNNLVMRGINVETTLQELTTRSDQKYLSLDSTKFQTLPVIHKNLHIVNFGGGIFQDEKNEDILNVYIPVNVQYDGNGVKLFDVYIAINKISDEQIFVRSVNHNI